MKPLLFLTFIVILMATAIDVYYEVASPGDFDLNLLVAVCAVLPTPLRIELEALDVLSLLFSFIKWRYWKGSFTNIKGTVTLMASFS